MGDDKNLSDEFRGVDRQLDKDILINWVDEEKSVPADSTPAQEEADLLPSPENQTSPLDKQQSPQIAQESPIGAMGKRFLAYLEDTILLGIVGFVIGTVFYGLFSRMGGWEIFIGFFIAVAYFGYMNSEKCNGQTWGKKQFKLRVVDKDGKCIPLKDSIFRAVIFLLPFFVFNISSLSGIPMVVKVILLSILGSAGIVLCVGLFLLYIFNNPTRQVPHDMIFKTYVVKAESGGVINPTPPKKMLVNAIYGISGLFVFILLAFAFLTLVQLMGGNVASQHVLEKVLTDEYPNDKITVSFQRNYMNGQKIDLCLFNVEGDKFPGKEGETISSFVENIRAKDPSIPKFDVYQIDLNGGYNLGIASYVWNKEYWYRPPVEGKSEKGTSGRTEKFKFNAGIFGYSQIFNY